MSKRTPKDQIGNLYFHVGNGGVTFSFHDVKGLGPTIRIKSSSFCANTITQELHVTKEGLKQLAKVVSAAAKHEYVNEPYINAAEPNPPVKKSEAKAEFPSLSRK